MAYKRPNRNTWTFDARTRTGRKQFCTFTPDKAIAHAMEKMWDVLALRHRAWDLLDPVLANPKLIGALYDRWVDSRQEVEVMRRFTNDADLEPLVAEWYAVHSKSGVEQDSADHALAHVRHFFPAGVPRLLSTVTADWLTSALAAYPGAQNTRRKVHSSLSVWFEYLVTIKKRFTLNPMAGVPRPKLKKQPIKVYDAETVAAIVAVQPTEARRAHFALVYGTGADISPSLIVDRADVRPDTHEVRIKGTKTGFRDRWVRVAETMWPIFWRHAKKVVAGSVFPEDWNRWTVSDWHRYTVGAGEKDTHGRIVVQGLNLSRKYPFRNARHFFAVRLLQVGAPVRVVAEQMGSDEKTILKSYGMWCTSAEDRERWDSIAAKADRRRKAGAGA